MIEGEHPLGERAGFALIVGCGGTDDYVFPIEPQRLNGISIPEEALPGYGELHGVGVDTRDQHRRARGVEGEAEDCGSTGAGALPAMLLTGRALDRWGLWFAAAAILALGVAGFGVAIIAHGFASLCVGLVVVGLASGATDVAMNSIAGRAEQASGVSIIIRSGGQFSSFVVLSSIAAGLSSWIGAPVFMPFLVVAALSLAASASVLRSLSTQITGGQAKQRPRLPDVNARLRYIPLLLVGVLGALAFASENAHQSWGAVFLEDELGAGPGFSSVGPAVFAGVVAIARFSVGRIQQGNESPILILGSITAAVGALVIAMSPTLPIAILGLIVAAAGTAALYPTMLSLISRGVDEAYRGRATAIVTTVSYIGFLLGPVYVGLWSEATGLRGALVAVAGLGIVLSVVALPLLRLSGYTHYQGARALIKS
ncbi:MFS transporter [Cryobacterium sp. TMT2-42-4]|uniref:MFS transporter n=1 Tax=Cryobacterium sp. TMT2-42-4 TaxID=1259255 RepID=UPI00106BD8BE|nr:MFS transporter [Cryobacterium sp. TMT2-42-4]TFC34615.1 MFS transporter [Cryobacterium sp. TMT2-42-4]